MASLRQARREFRGAVLKAMEAGKGDPATLMRLADEFYGDCGYREVFKAFHQVEIDNAVSQLRTECSN